ncbi:MAG TPA: clostripain-related cysteine peptidase, partial [Ignavibacteriaceae bacterium]|nr:clostripain-related cysteine peptidase [Ignavibacteriaceae bacterium]
LINSLSSKKKFDLIVLSTCKNGNEETVKTLSPYTDYLIASPGDIHLSHLNSESLINLNKDESFSVIEIANEFAFEAYNILSSETSTEITISVYDLTDIENDENLFTNSKIKDYYRPPEFGRSNK